MKKILYLVASFILILALAVGCTNDQDEGELTDGDDVITEEDLDPSSDEDEKTGEEILSDFEVKVEESLADAEDMIDRNLEGVSEIEMDEMVSKLMTRTEEELDDLGQKIRAIDTEDELYDKFGGEAYISEDQIDELENDDLREELERLYSQNYRMINLEGDYYPAVNYEAFKKYDQYVSDEVREYVDLKARDANDPAAVDGEIYISYEDLADRIVRTENYITQYGDGDRYGEAINMYRNKLSMYLLGLPNSSISEDDSDMIREDLIRSYRETALIEDSSTGFVVGKYINMINQNEGIVNGELLSQGQMLIEEATELIGTGK